MSRLLLLLLLPLVAAQSNPQQDLVDADSQERQILSELNEFDQKLYSVEQEISAIQDRADELEGERITNETELQSSQDVLDTQSARVSALLRAMYHINRRGFARIVFSAEDPADLRRRTRYLMTIIVETDDVVGGFREQVALKKLALEKATKDRDAVEALQAELRLNESALRDDRARRLALLDDIRSKRALALQALGERSYQGEQLGVRLSQQYGSASFSAGSYGSAEGTKRSEPFRSLAGKLRWPARGKVLRGFGNYTDPLSGAPAKNLGIDIGTSEHAPVRVVAAGTVTNMEFIAAYGQTVIVDHGDDYKTVYAHLGSWKCRVGQTVRRDDVIGNAGETGVTDTLGPRVHFEVRYHNNPQDPASWLESR